MIKCPKCHECLDNIYVEPGHKMYWHCPLDDLWFSGAPGHVITPVSDPRPEKKAALVLDEPAK